MHQLINMPAEIYFADPTGPSLSQSTANDLLNLTPRHAWLYNPKLGGMRKPRKACFDDGTIMHSMLLEQTIGGNIVLLDFADFRTQRARDERDAAIAKGKTPVLRKAAVGLFHRAKQLTEQVERLGLSLRGQAEGVVSWLETDETGAGVLCRGRLDLWQPETATIIEIKTAARLSVREAVRAMVEYGYDVQRAAYVSAIEHAFPDLAGKVTFINLFVSLDGEPVVLPFTASDDMRTIGESKWKRAVNVWGRCLREDDWPNTIEAKPPHWAVSAEFEEEITGS